MSFSGLDEAQQRDHIRSTLKPRVVNNYSEQQYKRHPPPTTDCDTQKKIPPKPYSLLNTPMHIMASSPPVSTAPGSDNKVADLAVISYEKLLRKDFAEAALLLSACAERGFFYLDLGGSKGDGYRKTVGKLFGVSKEYFAKPVEEKLKDTMDEEMKVFNICG